MWYEWWRCLRTVGHRSITSFFLEGGWRRCKHFDSKVSKRQGWEVFRVENVCAWNETMSCPLLQGNRDSRPQVLIRATIFSEHMWADYVVLSLDRVLTVHIDLHWPNSLDLGHSTGWSACAFSMEGVQFNMCFEGLRMKVFSLWLMW